MNPWNMRIVADSSADMLELDGVPFANAPLKIISSHKEYTDDAQLNVIEMLHELSDHGEKVSTACPSVGDWLASFDDAPYVFCVAITSSLSGSYNAAMSAKLAYEEEFPGRRVFVIDSLSAGPGLRLIVEKLRDLILEGKDFDQICEEITEYQKHTGLLFIMESLKNMANNGRVSRLVAGAVGILGIRVICKASDKGELEPLTKIKGEKKALPAFAELLKELGYNGGKIRIAHCINGVTAKKLKELILSDFPTADEALYPCRGLCSFYVEKGGILVGFEKG